MTPHLIPLYGSSVLAIGMLALFASHNRKTGWKKERGKLAESIKTFYEGAYADGSTEESAFREPPAGIPFLPVLTALETSDFTQQLIKLRASLGTAGNAPVFDAPRMVRETVAR